MKFVTVDLFVTVFGDHLSSDVNVLFDDVHCDTERGVVRQLLDVWKNLVIVKAWVATSQEYEIDNSISIIFIVYVSGRNLEYKSRHFQVEVICDLIDGIGVGRVIWKGQVPITIPYIEVPSSNEDIINIEFSVSKVCQYGLVFV